MKREPLTIAALFAYGFAIIAAVIIRDRRAFMRWASDWTTAMDSRREELRAKWLASEGIVEGVPNGR
jgi:hypothetical protein